MQGIMQEMAAGGLPLLAVFFSGFLLGLAAEHFSRLPGKAQEAKAKEWLLWAVASVEQELEGASGSLKLRRVYDLFLQRFPAMAKAVPFRVFCQWTEAALSEVENILADGGTEDIGKEEGKA